MRKGNSARSTLNLGSANRYRHCSTDRPRPAPSSQRARPARQWIKVVIAPPYPHAPTASARRSVPACFMQMFRYLHKGKRLDVAGVFLCKCYMQKSTVRLTGTKCRTLRHRRYFCAYVLNKCPHENEGWLPCRPPVRCLTPAAMAAPGCVATSPVRAMLSGVADGERLSTARA